MPCHCKDTVLLPEVHEMQTVWGFVVAAQLWKFPPVIGQ